LTATIASGLPVFPLTPAHVSTPSTTETPCAARRAPTRPTCPASDKSISISALRRSIPITVAPAASSARRVAAPMPDALPLTT